MLGFYVAYRPAEELCPPGCAMPSALRSSRLLLWVATSAAILFAAFPYYSGPVAGFVLASSAVPSGGSAQATLVHATIRIEGMDCAAWATAVERRLKAVAGLRRVTVSFELKRAEIDYDSRAATVAHIEKAIEDAGYRVRRG
jgi:copper chaperone CopZ